MIYGTFYPSYESWRFAGQRFPVQVPLSDGVPASQPGSALTTSPVRRATHVALAVFAANLLTSTLAPAAPLPFAQADWPTPGRAPAAQQVGQPPNLLGSTLASTDAPFAQTAWPVPTLRLRTLLVSVSSQPQDAPGTPTSQSAWPNPTLARTFRPTPPPNLLTTTLFPVGTPTSQADWPVPPRGRPAITLASPNLLASTLAPAADATPFVQNAWPVPQRPRARIKLASASGVLMEVGDFPPGRGSAPDRIPRRPAWLLVGVSSQPVAVPGTPAAQADWPNPRRAVAPARLHAIPNLLGSTLAPASGNPFAPTAWPNPQPARTSPAIGWTQDRKAYYQDQLGFNQSAWPTPDRPRTSRVADQPNLLATTLGQQETPFAQLHWPLPARRPVVIPPTLSASALSSTPFAQVEWPNPTRQARPAAAGWAQERKAYYVDEKPFGLTDWPTPARLRVTRTIDLPNLATSTLAPAAAVKPFLQAEWPNPAPVRRQVASGWTQDRKQFYADIQPPPTTTLWPNPQPRKLPPQLVQPDQLSGLLSAVPFAQADWPVPPPTRRQPTVFRPANLTGLTQPEAPLVPTAWPTPARFRFVRLPNPPNLLVGNTLAPPAGPAPFRQDLWPNPAPWRRQVPVGWAQERKQWYVDATVGGRHIALLADAEEYDTLQAADGAHDLLANEGDYDLDAS